MEHLQIINHIPAQNVADAEVWMVTATMLTMILVVVRMILCEIILAASL